ncbi:hypothetical protein PV733_07235 [Streptomyces europaeiscabiei]|uniref:hypothetical protein n=1 Tax=Streptomyces europaeiscabiei TaxID=146819 RepID=UPI0029BA524A|nr:hypothetical protein [Streptomyces europaeiscabiei]MDX3708767.1 hypothetical protein [Streptomyces europaeiscabiei]
MTRKFKNMQTPEQQYAATQAAALRAQADQRDAQARAASHKVLANAWDRPITEAAVAPARRERAEAERLRAEADRVEAAAKPKKRGWLR